MQLSHLDGRKILSANQLVFIKEETANKLTAVLALDHELLVYAFFHQ